MDGIWHGGRHLPRKRKKGKIEKKFWERKVWNIMTYSLNDEILWITTCKSYRLNNLRTPKGGQVLCGFRLHTYMFGHHG